MHICVQRAVIIIPDGLPEHIARSLVTVLDVLGLDREITQSTEVVIAVQTLDTQHFFRLLYPAYARQLRACVDGEKKLNAWEFVGRVTDEIPSDGRLTKIYLFLPKPLTLKALGT